MMPPTSPTGPGLTYPGKRCRFDTALGHGEAMRCKSQESEFNNTQSNEILMRRTTVIVLSRRGGREGARAMSSGGQCGSWMCASGREVGQACRLRGGEAGRGAGLADVPVQEQRNPLLVEAHSPSTFRHWSGGTAKAAKPEAGCAPTRHVSRRVACRLQQQQPISRFASRGAVGLHVIERSRLGVWHARCL